MGAVYNLLHDYYGLNSDNSQTKRRPHPNLVVDEEKDKISYGVVTLAYYISNWIPIVNLVARPFQDV